MDKNQLSNLVVRCLILKHTEANAKIISKGKYQDEIDYLVSSSTPRNNFIRNLALKIKGNTLILFQLVEKHGKELYIKLFKIRQKMESKDFLYIWRCRNGRTREKARAIVEKEIMPLS